MSTIILGSNTPDSVAEQLKPTKAGYGENNFSGASSDLPGERTQSRLAAEIASKSGIGAVTSTSNVGNVQNRDVSSASLPAAHGMKPSTAGTPQVPDSIKKDDAAVSPQPRYTTSK